MFLKRRIYRIGEKHLEALPMFEINKFLDERD